MGPGFHLYDWDTKEDLGDPGFFVASAFVQAVEDAKQRHPNSNPTGGPVLFVLDGTPFGFARRKVAWQSDAPGGFVVVFA